MNTYGIRSINTNTFNLQFHTNNTYPQQVRDGLITLLRVHNLTLNILGYTKYAPISGFVRMCTGLGIIAATFKLGDPNPNAVQGIIIGHWYDEAIATGITQVARGMLEALVPFGSIVNFTLDAIATVKNVSNEVSNYSSVCQGCMEYINHGPYPDPEYPLLLLPLYLA